MQCSHESNASDNLFRSIKDFSIMRDRRLNESEKIDKLVGNKGFARNLYLESTKIYSKEEGNVKTAEYANLSSIYRKVRHKTNYTVGSESNFEMVVKAINDGEYDDIAILPAMDDDGKDSSAILVANYYGECNEGEIILSSPEHLQFNATAVARTGDATYETCPKFAYESFGTTSTDRYLNS